MTKSSPVTIQDIAKKANVSISTVSRVLNDHETVGEQYKTAVLEAIEELDYQPNFFAQGLAGGQSRTIGVVTQNVGSPVYDAILKGILEGLSTENYSTIFADGQWESKREYQAIETLMAKRVDGLIIVGGSLSANTLMQINEQVPLINVGRKVEPLVEHCIYVDNFDAAYQATRFLLELGHKEIVQVTGLSTHQDAQERVAGYRQAIEDAGLSVNPKLIVEGNFRRQSGVIAMSTLLTQRLSFTAVFAANDQMAFGVRLALFRHGLRVPDDVSLIGFDDQPDSAFMIPPLTTVQQPTVEMGIAAAHAMLNRLKKNSKPIQNRFLVKLIARESTARII
jgi:LacI family transcriptional regulator